MKRIVIIALVFLLIPVIYVLPAALDKAYSVQSPSDAPTLDEITLPSLTLPPIDAPTLDEITLPSFTLPPIDASTLTYTPPPIDIPSFSYTPPLSYDSSYYDSGDVYVEGYYRSNGTYVEGYYRSRPDGNPYNNYSFPGNYNPYTGEYATGSADSYLRNYYGW